ncbi:MAG: hypothetical protein ACOC5T_03195 [Elusimicrobiota bacterium]
MSIIDQIALFEEDKETNLKLFVDLDGVLCDWFKAFRDLGKDVTKGLEGDEYEEKYGRDELWKQIAEHGKLEFWSQMQWMGGGKKLWNYIKDKNPTILTTPANSKFSKDGKKIWVSRELGKNVPIIMKKEKWKEADENSILIDDYDKKIKDWKTKGNGIGILHTSADKTIAELKKLGI